MNSLKLFDITLMVCAFLLAALVVLHQTRNVTPAAFFSMRVKINNFAIFFAFILLWHVILRLFGLYTSRRLSSRWREVFDVIGAASLGSLIVLFGGIVFHIQLVTADFIVVFWLVSTSLTVCSRIMLRATLALLRKSGRNLRDVIIVGTNHRALEFAERLVSRSELGYRIAGFVDHEWTGLQSFRDQGRELICDLNNLPQFLRQAVVDEVVIALPFRSMHELASSIASTCEQQGITVRVLSNILESKIGRRIAEDIEENAMVTHSTEWADGWPVLAKRLLDVAISFIAIVLLTPLFLIVSILIKLTSPGPILFVQKRVGLHKRHLTVYKFRTMQANAEERIHELEHLNEVSGPVFKIKNDPRITPLGRFLRKTSIDELPQLFNVLKGEMSLVGPRPLPVRDYNGFSEDWQRRRFSVKPGITCLWQIRGRSGIPFHKWMELDLQYIEKWSLWLDFQILLRTIPAVLKGSGAA